jgi:hypothetical protein
MAYRHQFMVSRTWHKTKGHVCLPDFSWGSQYFLQKNGFGYILCDFFTNSSSGRPAAHAF